MVRDRSVKAHQTHEKLCLDARNFSTLHEPGRSNDVSTSRPKLWKQLIEKQPLPRNKKTQQSKTLLTQAMGEKYNYVKAI